MSKIIEALEAERTRIDQALRILRGETRTTGTKARREITGSNAGQERLSPAARARIAEAQKERWKRYRKQQAA
jgi:hypothetical protein